ncbi:MAG: ATP synthase F0 subunit B [Deltaproteobacteria bacterium]|nr:ATP synthase F0 subunit B [Deltaproteobacteria bacterium]
MSHSLPPLASVVNFIVLLSFLIYILRKPVSNFLHTRSQTIENNLKESQELREQALSMLKAYEDKISVLDQEVEKILLKAKKDGEKEKEKILQRAEMLAQQIVDQAKRSSEREAENIRKKIEKQFMHAALTQAKTEIVAKASQSEHQSFLDHFLTQMEQEHGINR